MQIQTNILKVYPIKKINKALDVIDNKKGQTELSKVIEIQNQTLYNKTVNIII